VQKIERAVTEKLPTPGTKTEFNAHSITVNVKLINIYIIQSLHCMTTVTVKHAAESLALEHEKTCGVNSFYFCKEKMDILQDD